MYLLLCISGIDTIENYKIYETYMHFYRTSYTGKICQVSVDFQFFVITSTYQRFRLSYDNRVIYEDHDFLIILFLAPLAHADEINVQQLNNIGNYYL